MYLIIVFNSEEPIYDSLYPVFWAYERDGLDLAETSDVGPNPYHYVVS